MPTDTVELTRSAAGGVSPAGSLGDSAVEESFQAVRAAFRLAAGRHPERVHTSSYLIAGRHVTVRIVGQRLGRALTEAIAHLRVNGTPEAPALLIETWDEEETGVASPGGASGAEAGSAGITSASSDGRYVRFEQARTMSILDRSAQHIVGRVSAADELTQYEIGRPWHSELLLWQRDCGLQPLHAGCIERDGQGVLLGGPGGSGKSTTSLASMQDGWGYLADDYVGVERTPDGAVMAHGVYSSAHLEPSHLLRFPRLVPRAIPGRLAREDKSLVLLNELAGVRLAGRTDVRLIAFPRVVDRPESSFRPASKAEALLRLAPSSMLLLPYAGLGHSAFDEMTRIVGALPTFWLDVGRDLGQLPQAMNALLDEVLRT